TAPDMTTAERLGERLVEERLAACANIVPGIVSIYRWDDRVQRDEEVLIVLKTEQERVEALRERVVTLHPYDVPEVVVLPITGGHVPYLEWLTRSTTR
ncbi:MAG: divalent-cation tolerance protein CutA, partial [Candidatus Cloacimonetes bacterium]|nr:divalent-cation tolerance protein CutA [Candidatus Cloacimonadota bacterium]